MRGIKERILPLAQQVAHEQEVELFNLDILGKGRLLLRIMIDKEKGVTIDDCERYSRGIAALLDIEDCVPGPYTLEVSSPGLDRPLRGIQDFEKNIGKLVRVVTLEKIEDKNRFVGRISEVHGTTVVLMIDAYAVDISFENISSARLEVEL
jgi:ribosome maturation factor RimP